ncbi:hypothetical protein GCM10011356_16830 [Kangiella profundi]|nr:hypothetical protein GCM10011356_16830 [Kangiella profundi]
MESTEGTVVMVEIISMKVSQIRMPISVDWKMVAGKVKTDTTIKSI